MKLIVFGMLLLVNTSAFLMVFQPNPSSKVNVTYETPQLMPKSSSTSYINNFNIYGEDYFTLWDTNSIGVGVSAYDTNGGGIDRIEIRLYLEGQGDIAILHTIESPEDHQEYMVDLSIMEISALYHKYNEWGQYRLHAYAFNQTGAISGASQRDLHKNENNFQVKEIDFDLTAGVRELKEASITDDWDHNNPLTFDVTIIAESDKNNTLYLRGMGGSEFNYNGWDYFNNLDYDIYRAREENRFFRDGNGLLFWIAFTDEESVDWPIEVVIEYDSDMEPDPIMDFPLKLMQFKMDSNDKQMGYWEDVEMTNNTLTSKKMMIAGPGIYAFGQYNGDYSEFDEKGIPGFPIDYFIPLFISAGLAIAIRTKRRQA